jgi:hypothetical protein
MIMILLKTDGSWLVIASTLDTAAAPGAVLTDAEGHAVADANNNEIETQDPP